MIQKKIRLTEEEARFISTKVAESGMTNFNAFARIMLIMGEVKILNFEELRELRMNYNDIKKPLELSISSRGIVVL